MELLTLNNAFLTDNAAIFTAAEIDNQPVLWKETAALFNYRATDIHSFLIKAYREIDNIILTGAGTSAFIGLSLLGCFYRNTNHITNAVATTDIVSNPHDYFNPHQTTLIISFARSGNSPESCAALELADKLCKKCFHLIITCDKNGALAGYKPYNPHYVFVLPEKANDKSLAMTGSYSAMLLAGLMTAYIHDKEKIAAQLELLIQAAENIFSYDLLTIKKIAALNFKRAVFLGSGNLFGTAKEAALKLQELTDGKIICKADTYLGLRHGPKAVIDEDTLIVYFFSNNEYTGQYEDDLIADMKTGNNALFQMGIGERFKSITDINTQVNFGITNKYIEEDFLPVCAIIAGQLLGFYKSLQLGLSPDSPSVNGAISRVVQGVNIYPVKKI